MKDYLLTIIQKLLFFKLSFILVFFGCQSYLANEITHFFLFLHHLAKLGFHLGDLSFRLLVFNLQPFEVIISEYLPELLFCLLLHLLNESLLMKDAEHEGTEAE